MNNINPQISQSFLEEIKNQKPVIIDIDGIKIKICKNVFPPQSQFSNSSRDLHKIFDDLNGKIVLDVGTGTGIQALQAAKRGAKKVIAIDISDEAVSCARTNVKLNGFDGIITVLKSDLFESVSGERFDVIIANLPITDFPLQGIVESSLYDPGYSIHKRFF